MFFLPNGHGWQRRADFPAVADLVIGALTDNGFAVEIDALTQISDAAFAPYGSDPAAVRRLRQRFAIWRAELKQG